ncbi:MAG: aquaporin, partial [Clostridia bacterium]
SGRMSLIEFISYIIAQFAGGIAGAGILIFFFGSNAALGANGFGDASALGIGMWQAIAVEVVLSFVFVIAVLGVTSKKENSPVAGLVIGLTLTLVHILGIPFTGTSVNPARSFGPALLTSGSTAISQVWVFIAAPLVGAAIAAVVYRILSKKKEEEVIVEVKIEE